MCNDNCAADAPVWIITSLAEEIKQQQVDTLRDRLKEEAEP